MENHFDIAFICVPTNALSDGSCDTSAVHDAVKAVDADIYVIKSTVPPGTSALLANQYHKRIVFSPEQYGETQHAEKDTSFLILGGDKKDCAKVAELYSRVKPGAFRVIYTSWEAAELSKYMLNSFLAMKVTFCNEFADIAAKLDIPYPELKELFIQDDRVGPSHTWVYPDEPYYDSHCFNKDIPAFVKFAEKIGVPVPVISAVDTINRERKAHAKGGVL